MVAPDIVDHILALIVDFSKTGKEGKKSDSDLSSSEDSLTPVKKVKFNGDDTSLEDTQGSSNSSSCPCNIYSDEESAKSKVSEIHKKNKPMVACDSVNYDENKPIVRNTSDIAPSSPKEVVTEKREDPISVEIRDDKPKSVSRGWATILLRWSYKTAKEGLIRLAKIGYVGRNKDVEELVETGVAQTNFVMMREMKHISKLNTQQNVNKDRCREDSKPKLVKDLLPTRVTMGSRQRRGLRSTPSSVEVERVLAKDVEEIEEAKWKKKAANYAENETEVKDEEIWERIASDVRKCGVPVDILRKHELKITSSIIDAIIDVLRAEQQQDQDLPADLHTLNKEEIGSVAAEMADSSMINAESEGIFAKPPPAGLDTSTNQDSASLPARMPGSWPDSSCAVAFEHEGTREQSTSRLQDLYRHSTSYLERIHPGYTATQKGMHRLASDNSPQSRKGEVFQFDEQNSPSSRVNSLSKHEVKATSEGLAEINIPSGYIESSDQKELSIALAGKIRNSLSSTGTDAAASGASVKPSAHIAARDEGEVEIEVIDNDTVKGEENIDSENRDFTVDHDSDDVSDTSSDGREY